MYSVFRRPKEVLTAVERFSQYHHIWRRDREDTILTYAVLSHSTQQQERPKRLIYPRDSIRQDGTEVSRLIQFQAIFLFVFVFRL